MEKESDIIKNAISIGLIISNEDFKNSPIFPDEIKEEVNDASYYLLIYIARKNGIKINCFPANTNDIKKILIKLKEFTPEIVKGISYVLREMDLGKKILHTTGLCYEMENCFYETYLTGDSLAPIDNIKQKFMEITNVVNVQITDVPIIKK